MVIGAKKDEKEIEETVSERRHSRALVLSSMRVCRFIEVVEATWLVGNLRPGYYLILHCFVKNAASRIVMCTNAHDRQRFETGRTGWLLGV